MHRRLIPDVVRHQTVAVMPPGASARQAAEMMAKRQIGAVLVVERGTLTGIFSERDMVTRVVALGRDPELTMLAEVMTPDPETMHPNDRADAALRRMQDGGFRHLPIVDDMGRPVGIVSMRDFFGSEVAELEREQSLRIAAMGGYM